MKKLGLALVVTCTLMGGSVAEAALLNGVFTIDGLEDVRVSGGVMDFGMVGDIFGPPIGDIQFVTGTGSFDGTFDGNVPGTIKDLDLNVQPVGSAFTLDNFLVNPLAPEMNIRLTYIAPGTGTLAGCTNVPGAVCTLPGSPFTITNNAIGGSTVGLAVRGEIIVGADANPYVGAFSTPFPDMTADEILAQLAEQGFVQSSHAGAFVVTAANVIPEPASLLLFGSGLAALASRRRKNRKQA